MTIIEAKVSIYICSTHIYIDIQPIMVLNRRLFISREFITFDCVQFENPSFNMFCFPGIEITNEEKNRR